MDARVVVREVPCRGRGVFAARDLSAGEVVLEEAPAVLWPQHSHLSSVCSHCLRTLQATNRAPIDGPAGSRFCGDACAAEAASDPGSLNAASAALLARCNLDSLSDEEASGVQLLARLATLGAAAAAGDARARDALRAVSLLRPRGGGAAAGCAGGEGGATQPFADAETAASAGRAAAAAVRAAAELGLPLSATDALAALALEGANAYGILAAGLEGRGSAHPPAPLRGRNPGPSGPDEVEEEAREIRGGGLYPSASMFNHECLPNVAREDDFDRERAAGLGGAGPGGAPTPPRANARMVFRTLHAIPAGEELTISYFPLTWGLEDRQERCREVYGFECRCPRCLCEAELEPEDGSMSEEGDEGEGRASASSAEDSADGSMAEEEEEQEEEEEEGEQRHGTSAGGADGEPPAPSVDWPYVSLFLLKYVCPRPGCGGTLVPSPPPNSNFAACNVCGTRRSDEEFLRELDDEQ